MVRDKIAQILADESAMQVQIATTEGKPDPQQWALKVYTERATPWDDYTSGELLVNVWFDATTIDEAAANTPRNQTMRGTFNIDVLGFAVSKPDGSGGQLAGDELAAKEAQRGLRLVRNIIMADSYTYLDMRPLVGQRMPQSISTFQPQLNGKPTEHVVGARLSLGVRYEEYAPQYEPVQLQTIFTEVTRAEDGRVLAEIEIDFTP